MKKLLGLYVKCFTVPIRWAVRAVVISRAKKLLKRHNFSNRYVEGEDAYLQLWRSLYTGVTPVEYRFYSHYVGQNAKIVPEDVCHNFINPILNPVKFRGYYEDKNIYNKIFPIDYTPAVLLRKIGGEYFDVDYQQIICLDEEYLLHYINGCDRVVIKPSIDTSSGKGVMLFERRNGMYLSIDGSAILDINFLDKYGSDFIIQKCLTQSAFLNRLNATSINTIRISTYRSVKSDKVVVLGALIRIGVKGSIVDNAHAGGSFVGVDENGVLGKYVCNQYGDIQTTFNDIDFSKEILTLPDFDKIKDFAIEVSRSILHHRLLQLDVTVDDNGVIRIIEFNISGFSQWLYQLTGKSAFGEYTEEIIDYCRQNKHKAQKIFMSFA